MKTIFLCIGVVELVCLVCSVQSAAINQAALAKAWASFQSNYQRNYSSADEASYRKDIFSQKYQEVADLNEKFANGEISYESGINQFSDLTANEFRAYLGYNVPEDANLAVKAAIVDLSNLQAITSVDIRSTLSPIRNQKQCGSCWAFSSVSSLESAYKKKYGVAKQFSEQELVDCVPNGCNGGNMDNAFNYAISKGSNTPTAYPYAGVKQTCKAPTNLNKLVKYETLTATNVLTRLATDKVSIAVAVDASNWGSYRSGIFSNCGTALNHAVNLVGYYVDSTNAANSYLLVRNSWATTWGESGYIRLKYGNTCGVFNYIKIPSY